MYVEADGVWAISDADRRNMLALTMMHGESKGATSSDQSKFAVLRYIGSPWDKYVNGQEPTEANIDKNLHNPFSKRSGILFVGPGNVPTNVAAIDWFIRMIWPNISRTLPDLKFSIIGAWKTGRGKNAADVHTAAIREAMACKGDDSDNSENCKMYRNIQWTGKLSQKDLEKSLQSTRIFVSPIRFSTGVNTKNLLALERSLPLITSINGSSGLCPDDSCKTWKDGTPYIIAYNHSHFSDLVIRLYNDETMWKGLALSGKSYSTSVLSTAGGAFDVEKSLKSLGLIGG